MHQTLLLLLLCSLSMVHVRKHCCHASSDIDPSNTARPSNVVSSSFPRDLEGGEIVNKQPSLEGTNEKSWEDDDDDDSVLPTEDKLSLQPQDGAQITGAEESEKEPSTTAEVTGEKKSEWPDDDDDDDSVESASKINKELTSDMQNSNVADGHTAISPTSDETNTAEQEEVLGEENIEDKESKSAWPSADDDDDTVNTSVNKDAGVVDKGSKSDLTQDDTPATEDSKVEVVGEDKETQSAWPEDDDDIDTTIGIINNGNKEVTEQGDNHDENNSLILSEDTTASSAYHRSQSSEENGFDQAGDSEPVNDGGDITGNTPETVQEAGEMPMGEETGSNGAPNDGPDNVMNDEGTTELPGEDVPNNDISPTNENDNMNNFPPGNDANQYDWEDDEDDSFLNMVQSTFNVLLLAAFLTSILVVRKRVMDRVQADLSLDTPTAIKEELVDLLMRLASWVANRASGSGESGTNTEGNTATGNAGSSSGPETIPLSTATDEEWGWEDEDSFNAGNELELSGGNMRSEEVAKEDDDLAMAIAMSLSESQSGGDENKGVIASAPTAGTYATTSKPVQSIRPQIAKSSKLTSIKDKAKAAQIKPSNMTRATPEPETTPPSTGGGGDSIEDLLGQMGGSITSFGQKPKTTAKQKAPPKKKDSDDIFASMGLSQYPDSTASSQPKPLYSAAAPSSALAADTLDDADADSWGDDGDLDDLLDD